MSDVMMKALQLQAESLTRQVQKLGPENEQVRKLLTEFDQRHDADQARIAALTAENAALAEQVKRARGDALEEAARLAEKRRYNDNTGSPMLDMANAGRTAEAGDIAAAIRALRGATEGAAG